MSLSPSRAAPQKTCKGLSRTVHAAGYALPGRIAGWGEAAFQQEVVAPLGILPLALLIGYNWIEAGLLAGTGLLAMVVELLTFFAN